MIKEALQYIVGLKTPVIRELGGQSYSDKPLERISYIPYAQEIHMSTLTSLCEYIRGGIDAMSDKMIIHVASPTQVRLFSNLDAERGREYLVDVEARMRPSREGVLCAVFEADGGAWKNEAMANIKKYLGAELEPYDGRFTVIS
ncbi:MAG: hypothetical protein NC548_39695 [Lachnospiraceae bacterium]|nr:hypothetical protein [Lachnospiraceae bacterium]